MAAGRHVAVVCTCGGLDHRLALPQAPPDWDLPAPPDAAVLARAQRIAAFHVGTAR